MGSAPYEDPRLTRSYDRGNDMPETSLLAWAHKIISFSPKERPAVLDVGVGTGVFAWALADGGWPTGVTGVDPSRAMLQQAQRRGRRPDVHLICGDAVSLPFASSSFDLALLSRVVHHIPARDKCAAELHRVLRQRGVVVVRTTVRERLDSLVYDYWPQLLARDLTRFPSADDVIADFEQAGFVNSAVESYAQPVHTHLAAFHDAMALRPQSKFRFLSEQEFSAGLLALRRDVDAQPASGRGMAERYDLLVFAKPGTAAS